MGVTIGWPSPVFCVFIVSVIKIFLFILFISTNLQAGPSRFSCEYYEEVESEFSCGRQGYLRKFGIPLCQRYLSAESGLSPDLVNWLQEVRLCLQVELENNLNNISDCVGLKKIALTSHEGCYRSTGFCNLSFREKLKVLRLTSSMILNRDVLRLARKLPGICR